MCYEPGLLTNTIGWVARYRYHYVITTEGAEKSAPFFVGDGVLDVPLGMASNGNGGVGDAAPYGRFSPCHFWPYVL